MASADGWFYMFDVNTQEGGICKLLTQASIYSSNPALFMNNPKNLGNNNLVNNTIVNNTTNPNFSNNNNADEANMNGHHQQQQQQQQSFNPQQQVYENQHMDSWWEKRNTNSINLKLTFFLLFVDFF